MKLEVIINKVRKAESRLLFFELLISEGTQASQTNRIGAIAFFFVGFRERQRRKYIKHGELLTQGEEVGEAGRWEGEVAERHQEAAGVEGFQQLHST